MTRIMLIIFLVLLAASAQATVLTQPRIAPKRIEITVRQLTPIAFGTFASLRSGGSITIDPASGMRSFTGTISVLSGGDYGPAEFAITGQPGDEVIVLPPSIAILDKSGTGGDIVLTNFKVSPADIIMLDRQGYAKVKIGCTLKTPGFIAQGNYTGSFDVSARYLH